MRGRPRKPVAVQIAEGDPGDHGAHKLQEMLAREPKPMPGFPPCPSHLAGLSKQAWEFLAEQIEIMGIDKRPDAYMLEGACVAYEEAVAAYEMIKAQGRIIAKKAVDQKTGQLVVIGAQMHPAVGIGNEAWKRLRAFCSEFGLSPASRSRITAEKRDDGLEEISVILNRPRIQKAIVQ